MVEAMGAEIRWALGIDLGGTNFRLCAVGLGDDGRMTQTPTLVERWREEGARSDVSSLLDTLKRASKQAWAAWFGDAGPTLDRIGFAVAAQLGGNGRTVANAPNLGWRDVPLADLAAEAFDLAPDAVVLVNDLKAIVAGELARGALVGVRSAVAMYVGTGVGGALVSGGRIWAGSGGNAGEIGHVKLPTITAKCGCGQIGCVEAIAGGGALERRILAAQRVTLSGLRIETVADVDAGFAGGDPWCIELWSEVGEALSYALSTATTLFNPEVVLLGGGVLDRAPRLHALIESRSQKLTLAVAADNVRVRRGELGETAGCSGAGATALTTSDEW